MKIRIATVLASIVATLPLAAAGPAQTPGSGQAIIGQAIAAHGGDKLTAWRTLTVKGTVRMRDGISYNAAFTLRAAKPGRVRVDQDMTADQGRLFFEYFLHDGVAWMRRNLVVSTYDAKRMQRWLAHTDGVAAYAGQAAQAVVKEETDVIWPPDPEQPERPLPSARRAIRVVISPGDAAGVEILIDTQSHYLLGEVLGGTTRLYADFKPLGGVVWPTRILEIAKGRQGDTLTPFTYTSAVYNSPIEDWVFTEDKPAVAKH
jgi:hypothetical protein